LKKETGLHVFSGESENFSCRFLGNHTATLSTDLMNFITVTRQLAPSTWFQKTNQSLPPGMKKESGIVQIKMA